MYLTSYKRKTLLRVIDVYFHPPPGLEKKNEWATFYIAQITH